MQFLEGLDLGGLLGGEVVGILGIGDHGEGVAAERGHGQPLLAVEIADGIVGPGVADGDGLGDGLAGDFHLVGSDDLGLGPGPLLVFAADREAAGVLDIEGWRLLPKVSRVTVASLRSLRLARPPAKGCHASGLKQVMGSHLPPCDEWPSTDSGLNTRHVLTIRLALFPSSRLRWHDRGSRAVARLRVVPPRVLLGYDGRYFCVPLLPLLAANDGGRMGRVNGRA